MNTNDPQEGYGREPLLGDERMYDLCRDAGEPVDQSDYCGGPGLYSANRVRDFYEGLIASGKLRVAKEVEAVPARVGVTLSAECSECGASPIRHVFTFCPVCGSKIAKR